jgi:anti-anti-sigma factor
MGTVLVDKPPLEGSTITIRVLGDIDEAATSDLRCVLVDMIMHGRCGRVVVDLRGATGMEPGAIGTLCAACEVANDVRVSLVVCPVSRAMAEQLNRDGIPACPDGFGVCGQHS